MSQRRTLILVAAIAIGGLASFLVWNYVNGIQDEAYQGAERVPVYLIKQQVSRGMTGTEAQAYIVKENIPRKFKPSNAIANLEDISGKVALSNLVPNQVVVSDMFVEVSDARAQQSFAERLTKIRGVDMTAVTISVDEVRGVAGLVQPGDYVNMMVPGTTLDKTPENNGSADGGAKDETVGGQPPLVLLYQKVVILAKGQSAVPQPGDATTDAAGAGATTAGSGSGMYTLIVPVTAARWIAANASNITFTLVAPDYKPVEPESITSTADLPGMDPGQLTPYGKDGAEASD